MHAGHRSPLRSGAVEERGCELEIVGRNASHAHVATEARGGLGLLTTVTSSVMGWDNLRLREI